MKGALYTIAGSELTDTHNLNDKFAKQRTDMKHGARGRRAGERRP
jgi:hypothetical protein